MFVAEVPANFHGWLKKPHVLRRGPVSLRRGRKKNYPRLASGTSSCEVQNLLRYSPAFRQQRWQRYRVKDTTRGPEVWEVKWVVFWRKTNDGLPSRRQCLLVARNVLTGEVKYFVSNRVPGERGISMRWLLRVAFGRWSVEDCFRQAKEELGLDHYEVRGWRCVHRHFYLTQLSHLFCARLRQEFDEQIIRNDSLGPLSMEEVRRAVNVWLQATTTPSRQTQRLQKELDRQQYYEKRRAQSQQSHTKTRTAHLEELGISAESIKNCLASRRPLNSMQCHPS